MVRVRGMGWGRGGWVVMGAGRAVEEMVDAGWVGSAGGTDGEAAVVAAVVVVVSMTRT